MKYISRILLLTGLVIGLTGCRDALGIYEPGDKQCEDGEVPVNITMQMPRQSIETKSKVSGDEEVVKVMQMVCFDANGLYLGIRDAEVSSNGPRTTAPPMYDTGTIKGTVPEGTSRIHFIANRNLSVPLSFNVGTAEETVMKSLELSTKWDDADHKKVCYWGYHKESGKDAMRAWLNPTSTPSYVYMIRDRARIILQYDASGAQVPVTKVEWLIHNGNERGYLAPKSSEWENYYANSTVENHISDLVSIVTLNEYSGSRYSLWTSEEENDDDKFDVAYENGANTLTPQFMFDDGNEAIDDVKVILKVTYTVDGASKLVYHVLRLNRIDPTDPDGERKILFDVVRNNTYYIDAKLLSPDVAFYETLEAAVNGTEFVNADVEVDRTIPDINDNQYTLQIKLPTETTSVVLNTVGTHNLDFVFRLISDINTSGSTNPADFEISWEKAQTFCSSELSLTYVEALKQFQIHCTVLEGQLTDKLQDEWIVVKHKATGLTRYIHVYVIDQFRYKIYPTLTLSKAAQGTANPAEYVLHFQIPPMEHTQFLPDGSPDPNELVYPASLYPIDVKFTTNTLNAYGIQNGVEQYGLFGVSIEDTEKLTVRTNFEEGYGSVATDGHPISTTATNQMTQWYYQQANNYWDFWYTYSIKTCPDQGDVYIYFKDVRNHIQYATVANVGLFLYIEYFGKNYSVPVTQ